MKGARTVNQSAFRWAGISLVSLGITSVAHALEYAFDVEAGVGYTDNAARASAGEERSETLGVVELTSDLQQTTTRLTAILRSDLQFVTYGGDALDDETLGGIDLALDYTLVPRVLGWIFIETFGQQATDPFRAVGALNRENVNYATTGPRITAPLGPRNFMEFTVLRSTVSYEESSFDNDRDTRQVAIGRRVSEHGTVSIIRSDQAVSYEQSSPQNANFETKQSFVRWQSEAPRTSAQFDLGEMELDIPAGLMSEPLVRASITRQLSSATFLSLDASRLFSDAGESFRGFQGSGLHVGAPQDVVGTAEPFEDRQISIGLTRDREATGLDFRIGRSEELGLFDASSNSRDVSVIDAEVSRQFNQLWTGTAGLTLRRREFLGVDQVDDETYVELNLERALGRRMSLGINLDSFDRESTAVGGNIKERRIFLTMVYSPLTAGDN
jgi:hypothetical protein